MPSLVAWWWTAPWWALSLIFGPTFGLLMAWNYLVTGQSLTEAAGYGALAAVIFGPVAGPVAVDRRRREQEAAGDLLTGKEEEVYRAVLGGPVPHDAAVLDAARRVGQQWLTRITRRPALAVTLRVLALVGAATFAVLTSLGWLLHAAIFAGSLGWQLWTPRHLRRRLAVLRQPLHGRRPAASGPAIRQRQRGDRVTLLQVWWWTRPW